MFLKGVFGTSARVGVGRGDVGGDDELGTFKTSGPGEPCCILVDISKRVCVGAKV